AGHVAEQLVERGHTRGARRARPLVAAVRNPVGVPGLEIRGREPPVVKRRLRLKIKRPLAKRDHALGKRPQLLRLWQRGDDPLVGYERSAQVPKERDAMLRLSPEFSMSNSVSHALSYRPLTGGLVEQAAVLIEPHSEVKPHRRQDFFYLVERLPAKILCLEHLRLGFLNKLADRPNIRVLETVVRPDGQL